MDNGQGSAVGGSQQYPIAVIVGVAAAGCAIVAVGILLIVWRRRSSHYKVVSLRTAIGTPQTLQGNFIDAGVVYDKRRDSPVTVLIDTEAPK